MGLHYMVDCPMIVLGSGDTSFNWEKLSKSTFALSLQKVSPGPVGRDVLDAERSENYAMILFQNIESLDVFIKCLNDVRSKMIEASEDNKDE